MLEALIAAIGQSAKAQGNTFWTRKLTMGTPVQVHLAVMVEPYLSRVLDGSKTIESRFSRKKIAPWGRVSVSKKWQTPLFRESKFGQPEVARICKELILQAKSTTREAGKAGLHE